mmetsp:Transcript_95065/g.293064  ORF Transcript_95065/g.293064 Transcript_95065/m.293064 type:complete len:224 (-) Transcript_95065:10-681(-)
MMSGSLEYEPNERSLPSARKSLAEARTLRGQICRRHRMYSSLLTGGCIEVISMQLWSQAVRTDHLRVETTRWYVARPWSLKLGRRASSTTMSSLKMEKSGVCASSVKLLMSVRSTSMACPTLSRHSLGCFVRSSVCMERRATALCPSTAATAPAPCGQRPDDRPAKAAEVVAAASSKLAVTSATNSTALAAAGSRGLVRAVATATIDGRVSRPRVPGQGMEAA